MTRTNPYVKEIIKDSLMSIGEEMFVALARTSMSPIIYEVLDYACGLTDAKGNLISQGNGVTSFIGMLSPMVKSVLDKFEGGEDLRAGDIIIINDPYIGGGSHLSDVGLVMPIFHENKLVAFSANKGHWTDVGGKNPGSLTSDSSEIYQEGLQLSGVKLFDAGILNKGVETIITDNIRLPQFSIGDMWAQVAALRTGEKRFKELCDLHSKETIEQVINDLISSSEEYSQQVISSLPKGVFEAEDYIEGDPEKGGPYKIKVKVTITEDEFICDFRGSHPQVAHPVNCSYFGLLASVRVMYLAIVQPQFNITEGLFRPLKIITDEKSILSAERPAPVSMNFEARLGGAELIWKALAPEIPEKLPAGHSLSVCSVTVAGTHPDNGEDFLIVEPSVGGWGAANEADGQSGQFCMGNGETYNVPIEVAEAKYGVLVDNYGFRKDSSGAGEYIGGRGVVRSYEILSDNQYLSATYGRHQFKPWGMKGGEKGASSYIEVHKSNGDIIGPLGVTTRLRLDKGDVVDLVTPSGGGYGNPSDREYGKVERDIKNGFYTEEEAIDQFGYKQR
ncbi:hydantoinase B/oxoprolinase family protein [Salinicoccus sp. ID82-1]|uniref:Hydantoinase B/oxoprolinase family protein n=1 Tax=Salinicoccus cyprini TaxID=2493691 RepID=A0A558AT23_9STAP|nr:MULTISPECIES: hydantoinase B/oxoprolinase family protein [Salinicoccus]MCG1009700.1 hydantoinase B/oxoprolinase family protein [Salinicoccus sp. ID82-1]TVT27419.1 hydantoinase B/oxoprolinase family protein [Salinicoccus cyprini]